MKEIKKDNLGGQKLRKWMKENNLTQLNAEELWSYPKNSLSKYVRCVRLPGNEKRKDISERTNGFVDILSWDCQIEEHPIVDEVKPNDTIEDVDSEKIDFKAIRKEYKLTEFCQILDGISASFASINNWYYGRNYPNAKYEALIRSKIEENKIEIKDTEASTSHYKESAQSKINEFLKNKRDPNGTKEITNKGNVIIIKNKPDTIVPDRDRKLIDRDFVKFKEIKLVDGVCGKDCIFHSCCFTKIASDFSVGNNKTFVMNLINKFTNETCSSSRIFKYREVWVQANFDNVVIGNPIRRKENQEVLKVIEKIQAESFRDTVICESQGQQFMIKYEKLEVQK